MRPLTGLSRYSARWVRRLKDRTAAFICITDYVQRLVLSAGVPGEQTRRIYCATDTRVAREFPSSLRAELEIEADAAVVGTTGVWRPNKGFTYYIAAGEMVHNWHPKAQFLLGGRAYSADATYATQLWMRGLWLRSLGALAYTGFTPEVGRFLSALDVFVLPSDCEPFGLVLIEAMARGVAVVATDAGGVPEIVEHGRTGLLVPPRDPAALADAIAHLLDHPQERRAMAEAGRTAVRQRFDQGRMLDEYQTLYARVLAGVV